MNDRQDAQDASHLYAMTTIELLHICRKIVMRQQDALGIAGGKRWKNNRGATYPTWFQLRISTKRSSTPTGNNNAAHRGRLFPPTADFPPDFSQTPAFRRLYFDLFPENARGLVKSLNRLIRARVKSSEMRCCVIPD